MGELGDWTLFAGWEARYRQWLDGAAKALSRGELVEALADGYPFLCDAQTPFSSLQVPLAQAKLGLVTTAGVYLKREQSPFRGELIEGDPGCRELPLDVTADRIAFGDEHFSHEPAQRDWNVVFPVDRLRALVEAGRIGGIGALLSISGYVTNAKELFEGPVQAVVAALEHAGCDAVVVVSISPVSHQSGALVARAAEVAGVPSVEIAWFDRSLARIARPRVLRSPFARFPEDWSAPLGPPGNRPVQEAVVTQAVAMLADATPGEVRPFREQA